MSSQQRTLEQPADRMQAQAQALRDLVVAGERFRTATARALGIGARESAAIDELARHGPMTAAELAASLGLTSGTLTNLTDRLEAAELAERQPHPSDRRRALIILTPRAHQLLDDAQEWLVEAVRPFADDAALAELLQALAQRLQDKSGRLDRPARRSVVTIAPVPD